VIAIPAYQADIIRAQVTEGFSLADPYGVIAPAEGVADLGQAVAGELLMAVIAEAIIRGDAPLYIDSSSLQLGVRDGRYVQSVQVHSGAIVITYGREANAQLQSRHLMLFAAQTASGDIVWVCGHAQAPAPIAGGGEGVVGTTDVDDKYLPSTCRSR
jgi:type IV pilus assembly protein PilA